MHTIFYVRKVFQVCSPHGLQPETQYSQMANIWIEWIEQKEGIIIENANNGKEIREGAYLLDGFYYAEKPLTTLYPGIVGKIAFEFNGCLFHGLIFSFFLFFKFQQKLFINFFRM